MIVATRVLLTLILSTVLGAPLGAQQPSIEALAALRAVASVISGGATTPEFRKYYLEAKTKVDALPPTPEHDRLRHIAQLYQDAARLLTAGQTKTLSAEDVSYFKAHYAPAVDALPANLSDEDRRMVVEALTTIGLLPKDGFRPSPPSLLLSRDPFAREQEAAAQVSAKWAEQGAVVLFYWAAKELRELP